MGLTVTRLAGAFDGLDSRANAAAFACSTLPAVFATHPRRLGEHYSAHSLGCGFSGGPIGNRFGLSSFTTDFAGFGTPVRGRNLNAVKDYLQGLF